MKEVFKIGQFVFEIKCDQRIELPENFYLFKTNEKPIYFYSIQVVDLLPQPSGSLITKRDDIEIYDNNHLESRLIGIRGIEDYYGYYQEIDDSHAHIFVLRIFLEQSNYNPIFTSILALERRMIDYDNLLLHCAYLNYQDKAILFSAPSQTGKSTQAGLWQEYYDCFQVNGDRSLLIKKENWFAAGWPVCGTSGICRNENHEIRAIVMLSQAKENKITRLHGAMAFQQLYSQITVNSWNIDYVNKVFDLIENLISEVPVYHLECNISKEAVECLKNELGL